MAEQNFSVLDLEKHETKDVKDSHINGELTIIWRDWDEIIKNPQMVYLNTVNPGEINQMINRIYKIYNNKSYRSNLINNSNKTLIKFDRNKIIDKVYNVYENL